MYFADSRTLNWSKHRCHSLNLHCHVYFDENTEEKATFLAHEKAKQDFPDLSVGTFHKKLVWSAFEMEFLCGLR